VVSAPYNSICTRRVRLPGMTYHESLWVAAAAAAPVIALASIVSVTEARSRQAALVRDTTRAREATRPGKPDPVVAAQPTLKLIGALDSVSFINIILQFFVLSAALWSLADNRDYAPLRLAVWGEPFGLFLLFIGAYLSANLHARDSEPSGTKSSRWRAKRLA